MGEKILDKREGEDGSMVYKVKWRGYGYEDCTWEPLENLTDDTGTCVHLERYEEKLKLKETLGSDEEEDMEFGKGKSKKRKGSDEEFEAEEEEEDEPEDMEIDEDE